MGRKYIKKLQDALITNEFFGQTADNGCPYGCCRVHGPRAAADKTSQFPTLDHDIVGTAALVCSVLTLVLGRCSPGVFIVGAVFAVESQKANGNHS